MKGDSKAIELIYDHYQGSLYGVLFAILKDEELANEVFQQSIIKIWKNANTYDPLKSKLFTWMLNICRNSAFDLLKSKEYKMSSQNQNIGEVVSIVDQNQQVELEVDHIGLKELLNTLSQEQKELVEMMYFQGYTQAEVAENKQMPLGTVKTKLRNAIIHLRKYIK